MVTSRRAAKCVTHQCCDCIQYEREQLRAALRIIATWAACDDSSQQTRAEAMQAIEQLAIEALRRHDGDRHKA